MCWFDNYLKISRELREQVRSVSDLEEQPRVKVWHAQPPTDSLLYTILCMTGRSLQLDNAYNLSQTNFRQFDFIFFPFSILFDERELTFLHFIMFI